MKTFLTLVSIGAITLGSTLPSQAGAQTLQDAIKLTNKEQFERATAAFKQLIIASPQNGEVWFYMGENYWESEHPDSAEYCYHKGLEGNPHFALNTVGIGKTLWVKGKKPEAQAQFEGAVASACDKANKNSKPAQAKVYREVAEALVQGVDKDFAKAQEFIAKAIGLDPKDPETFILKGDALFDANPRDGSAPLENYKLAMNLDPLNAKPVARKAFMYYRAKNFSGSIEEYTNALAIDPAFAPAYSGRAEAYFAARDFNKATADMDKYLELNKGSMSARVRYAQFLFLVKKYDESLQEITTLQQNGVKNNTLKRIEAYDLCEKGDFQNALDRMNEYLAEQPQDKVIALDYEYLGKIHQGIAKNQETNPAVKIVNGTAVINDPGAHIANVEKNTDGSSLVSIILMNHDSLSAEFFLKAVRMDRTKDNLYAEATKEFVKAKLFDQAIAAMREKIANTRPETNDYYYLGNAANKGKRWMTADSAWATYIQRNPTAYQGYMFRARAQAGMDSTQAKTFAAKPYYEDMIRKMKPEEQEKGKADLEEALNYMGLYYLYNKDAKDLPKARCFFEKVQELNAGTSITKQVTDVMLKTKELKDIAPGNCDVL